jgi:hypothetical protein
MNRREGIKEKVRALHDQSYDPAMREWFFVGHVLKVAAYAEEIAKKELVIILKNIGLGFWKKLIGISIKKYFTRNIAKKRRQNTKPRS